MHRRTVNRTLLALSCCCLAVGAFAADRHRVVNEGGIRDQWMLADGIKLAGPGYPAEYKDRGDSVCVAVAYAINPDGTTADFTLLRQWNSAGEEEPSKGYYDAFASAAAGALSQWKFKPRPEVTKPQRTITVATMHFMGKEAMDVAALQSHCKIGDLAATLQQARHKRANSGLIKSDLEQAERAGAASNTMISNPGLGGNR